MIMTSVITLSSDEDDDGIQIIGEKLGVLKSIKEESINRVAEQCYEPTEKVTERISPSHLSSSVTISTVRQITVSHKSLKRPALNGEAHHQQASDNSDDDIICLDSGNRNSDTKEELVLVPSDDEHTDEEKSDKNGNIHKNVESSSRSDVILIESGDESGDQKSSESAGKSEGSDSSDDEVQVLEAEDLSNFCHAEGSSDDQSGGSRGGVENDKPERSATSTKKVQVLDHPSTSSCSISVEKSTSSPCNNQEIDELSHSGPGNLTEKLLKQLNVKISLAGFSEENKATVTKKIMKYYSTASEEFTQSPKFIDQVRNLISELSRLMALPNSKDLFILKQMSDRIKEFLGEFQRGSTQLTPKLNKLHKMLDRLNQRIQKLETQEVDSDSEYENSYVMLDRYRKRAVQVYNKIRQLEGRSNHADRLYLQEFIYSGVGPVPIQRALEKYYNKTKNFPDFAEVYKLVKKVNTEKGLALTPSQVHLTAQQVFVDFGKKLKRRREYDDFLIARSYLPESQIADPADSDVQLQEKLNLNKTLGRTEEDVLRDFVTKEASGVGASKEGEGEESGESSKSDAEDSETEKDESDKPKKMFMDSDEEMDYFENVDERRRAEDEPVTKKMKTEGGSRAGPGTTPAKSKENSVEPDADQTNKRSFLNKIGLESG